MKTASALQAKKMEDGNAFRSLSRAQSNPATRSHYGGSGMNMTRVKSTAKARKLDDTDDVVGLKEDNLTLRKTLKTQEKQLKKLNGTIRRLEKVNAEKDKILDGEDEGVQNYGSSIQDPVALRKRIAKLQVQMLEKDAQIDELRSTSKSTALAETQAMLTNCHDEMIRLQEIIDFEREKGLADESGDEGDGYVARADLIQTIELLKRENKKLKSTATTQKKNALITRPGSANGRRGPMSDADKAKIAKLSKEVKLLEAQLAGQLGELESDKAEKRLRKNISDLKQDQVDLDRDMAGYKRENTELQAEVEKLQGFLSTKSTEFEQYKTKTEQFSRDNRKREDNLDQKFQGERKQALNKMRQLEDENYRLKRNIQQFEETMNKTMEERSTWVGKSFEESPQISRVSSPNRGRTPPVAKSRSATPRDGASSARSNRSNRSGTPSGIDTIQNALRGHQVREQSLDRLKAEEIAPVAKKPTNKRTTWTSDQRNALKTLQAGMASHNIRQEFMRSSTGNQSKVTNVQVALKSHKIRQDQLQYS